MRFLQAIESFFNKYLDNNNYSSCPGQYKFERTYYDHAHLDPFLQSLLQWFLSWFYKEYYNNYVFKSKQKHIIKLTTKNVTQEIKKALASTNNLKKLQFIFIFQDGRA